MADGIKGLPLVKDSVSMAVDKTEGLKICGDMKFDIWKMKWLIMNDWWCFQIIKWSK